MDLEEKKRMVAVAKAKAAIEELEYKILERQEDIKRLEEHILKQFEVINEQT